MNKYIIHSNRGESTYIHDSFKSALNEAKRLASRHPQIEFMIFKHQSTVKGIVSLDMMTIFETDDELKLDE